MSGSSASKEPTIVELVDAFTYEFDKLFRHIATTKKYNDNRVENYAMRTSALTDQQCQVVKNLSGFLIRINEEISGFRNRSAEYRSLEAAPNPWLKYHPGEIEQTIESLKQTIALQRDYLVLELCRSEDLQKTVKEREEQIVTITAERDNYVKKLLAHKAALSEQEEDRLRSQVETAAKAKVEEDPQSLLNSFVRKEFNGVQFFGVIARYKEPYFKVVYEDADSEDLSKEELAQVLWNRFVPQVKVNACMKHMKSVLAEAEEEEEEDDSTDGDNGSSSSEGSSAFNTPEADAPEAAAASVAVKPTDPSASVVNIITRDSVSDSLNMEVVEHRPRPAAAAPSLTPPTAVVTVAPSSAARIFQSSPSSSVGGGSIASRVTPPSPLITAATAAAAKVFNAGNKSDDTAVNATTATTDSSDSQLKVVAPAVKVAASEAADPQKSSPGKPKVVKLILKRHADDQKKRAAETSAVAIPAAGAEVKIQSSKSRSSSSSSSSSSNSEPAVRMPHNGIPTPSGSASLFGPAGGLKMQVGMKRKSDSSSGSSTSASSKSLFKSSGNLKSSVSLDKGSFDNPIYLD